MVSEGTGARIICFTYALVRLLHSSTTNLRVQTQRAAVDCDQQVPKAAGAIDTKQFPPLAHGSRDGPGKAG
jgi:hypothetical protein